MGYKKIWVHLVYDVNHDGRHKAKLVSDGHIADIPVESFYSGVVSLRRIWLRVFLSGINKMETWDTYILNSYIEAKTLENIFIIFSLFTRRYMVSNILALFFDMKGSLIVLDVWVSSC